MMADDTLDGNTLNVYAYIVRADKPVGTRDVTRGATLSSSSVAHRHLQKLEDMGLIEKDSYGGYFLKKKAKINGYVWVGKHLVLRLMFYSLFFMGAFAAEISLVLLSFVIKNLVIEVRFLFLTGMTLLALILFVIEWRELYCKLNPRRARQSCSDECKEILGSID
jgi:hypothetical protein